MHKGLIDRFLHSVFKNTLKLILKVFFFHTAKGTHNIKADSYGILASNHASFIDPPAAGVSIRQHIFYLARRTLVKNKFMQKVFYACNTILIDRDRGDISAIKGVIRAIEAKKLVLIFPEGTRTLDGNLQPAKQGFAQLAYLTKCPVYPIYIDGSYKAMPKGRHFPRPCKITVYIGAPIAFDWENDFKEMEKKDIYEIISSRTMAAIAALKPAAK